MPEKRIRGEEGQTVSLKGETRGRPGVKKKKGRAPPKGISLNNKGERISTAWREKRKHAWPGVKKEEGKRFMRGEGGEPGSTRFRQANRE